MALPFRHGLGALALTISSNALGQHYATATLEQNAPDGANCATSADLTSAVEQRLQRRVFANGQPTDLRVRVSYGAAGNSWTAQIELFNARGQHLGQRRIASQNSSCSRMDESLALVVAIMVDLTRADVEERSNAASDAESTLVHLAGAPKVAASPPSASVTPTVAPTWTSVVMLGGSLNVGQLPNVGLGARVAAELRRRSTWSLEAGISAYLPSRLDDGPSAQARFSLGIVDLAGCVNAMTRRPFDLALCLGSALGLERAAGSGYRIDRIQQSLQVAPFARAYSTWWPTERVGLRLSFGLAAPLSRNRVYATRADDSVAVLHQPALLVPELQAGVCLAL